jgi:two-component system CheB/CheR fusion protein
MANQPPHPDHPRDDGLPSISPDVVEENHPEEIDNVIPSKGFQTQRIVGLGGSAGSIQALQAFFAAMPADSGAAFVVVLHLSPDHTSSMPSIVSKWTKMEVFSAEDGIQVKPNCVYIIPPGKHLWSSDGHLRLTDLEPERGRRVAVDLFFRSLADTHGPHATAIVLSGADSDGTIGVKRIKERGGLTIAQEPEEAAHHSMPQSAIATGMIDWVLPVAAMPARMLAYIAHERRIKMPPEDGPQPAQPAVTSTNENEKALREVLAFLRARTGRDFSYYKRATIIRRITRRMQINGSESLPDYLTFLRIHPGEAGALLQDLLISVTNFFRDRESFEAVEALIPELFHGKGPGDMVRVWCPACATGEEAYSMALMLLEHARTLDNPPGLQVFGCDLDDNAIQAARAGIYPETIAADVSEERLRRFFLKEVRGLRVRREVREIVLFACHDLLKDAPFSRMDLISCRNLLIYLNRDAQKRALDIFHFALRPNGLLFLGSSEAIQENSPLFDSLDKKHRIYRHRPAQKVALPVPTGPSTLARALEAQEHARGGPVLPGQSFDRAAHSTAEAGCGNENLTIGELHFRLVERFGPPSVIVNSEYEIVHLSETAGRFLQLGGGEPTMNLLRVVHPMLRAELRAALFQAVESSSIVELTSLPLEMDGTRRSVNIRISPARELAPGFLLISFEMGSTQGGVPAGQSRAEPEPVVRQLEREIEVVKARLRDTVEQYEANTEELKASNEELQAMNEELRSATEELETSREELQSINEELATVNQELKSKLEELSHTNSDLHNLMGATAIPTVFLDRDLRIMRYTPTAAGLFRIIPGDIGRPLADLRHRLDYPEMSSDALRVLETLTPTEREVNAGDSNYLARLLPYRTLDDHIGGVVLAVVDITESKRTAKELRVSEERLRLILESAKDYAIFTLDLDRKVTSWNPGANLMLGYTDSEILGQVADILFTPEDRQRGDAEKEASKALKEGRAENERWHLRKDGSRRYCSGMVRPLTDALGDKIGFVKIMRDLTQQKEAEAALRASEEQFRRAIEDAPVPVIMHAEDGVVLQVSRSWTRLTGYKAEDLPTFDAWLSHTQASADLIRDGMHDLFQNRAETVNLEIDVVTRSGDRRLWQFNASTPGTLRDGRKFVVGMALDITERRSAEEALRRSRSELVEALAQNEHARKEAEKANSIKDHFLATLSHELRTPLTPILMATETLLRRSDLPPLAVEALQMISRSIEVETHLVDDLLDITKISRGTLELHLERMNLHNAITRALEITEPRFQAKRQKVSVALDAAIHEMTGDFRRLQQVFWNLLINASKFTPEEGEIRVLSRIEGSSICVDISDTGRGIDPSVMPDIFLAFRQGDESVAREYGGLGLGLAISKATVEALGGSIVAASPGRGCGSTFTVKLPISKPVT